MGKLNIKMIAIVVVVIVALIVGIFMVTKTIKSGGDKNYTLEKVSEKDYKYFAVFTDNKYGVIDEKGNMIIENKYEDIIIPNPTKPVFIVINEDETTEVLNDKAEKIFTDYGKVKAISTNGTMTNLPYEKSVLKYEEDGKYGLIDFSGNAITKAVYEEISSVRYKEGEILAKKDGKYGVINNKGVELIPFEYEEIEGDKYYSDNGYSKSGYIVKTTTKEGYRYGYINSEWENILGTEYINISRILDINSKDVYLIVSRNGQYGVVKNKNVEIDFAYQSIEYNKDINLFAVERNGQYGVLAPDGKTIVNIEYKEIKFNGEYILAKTYTNDIYFNKNGQKVENSYASIIRAEEAKSYITVDENNLYGIVNENWDETVKNQYLYIEYVFKNYFVAYKDGKGLGLIDNNGKVLIDFKYDVLSKIEDRNLLKAMDMENNVTDIYSEDMKKITSLSDATIEMEDEYVKIYNNKAINFVTNNGELKAAKEILTDNKLFAIYKNGKWGFADKDGNIKVQPTYENVTEFNRFGFAGISKDDKWGSKDENGNVVCEEKFQFEIEEEASKPDFIGKYYKTYTESNEICYTDEI